MIKNIKNDNHNDINLDLSFFIDKQLFIDSHNKHLTIDYCIQFININIFPN